MGAGFGSYSSVSTTDSSTLNKYTVDVYDDLLSLSGTTDGNLAHVRSTTGNLNPFATRRLKGLYELKSGVWEYASQDLQDQLVSQQSEIDSNQGNIGSNDADILALQNGKLNSVVAGSGVSVDVTDPLSPVISAVSSGGISEAPSDGALYMRDGENQTWIKKSGLIETFPISSVEGSFNVNSGQFYGVIILAEQGSYNKVDFQSIGLNLSINQYFTVRCGVYSNSGNLLSQGSLILNDTNNVNTHTIDLDTDIDFKTPQSCYVVMGANDNSGGGQLRVKRQGANNTNDSSQIFNFQNNTGLLPSILPTVSQSQDVLHQIYYFQ